MANMVRQAHGSATTPAAAAHGPHQTGPRGARPAEATLENRAAVALRRSDFSQAIELFKRLVKQDPRPEWRRALKEAYAGRARMLAAKGLFEQAEAALAKASAGGDCPDPLLWAQCLIKRGLWRRAATAAVDHIGKVAAPDAAPLAELAAALWLAGPFPLTPRADNPEAGRWAAQALAAHECLAAWTGGRPPSEVDELLGRIPLRSAFRAVRLVLKSVMTATGDPARARELVAGIPPGSPFASLRLALEAALPGGAAATTAAQQMFAGEVRELPGAVNQLTAQWMKAERSGPGALLSLLTLNKQILPADDTRSACLALLPAAADQLRRFEGAFGALPPFERSRVLALAAQAKGDWGAAAARWNAAARSVAASGATDAQLSAAVIYRHLAELASEHREIGGAGSSKDQSPEIEYLKLSLTSDPDHLPAVLRLLRLYRARSEHGGDASHWHGLAEDAARRFPEECGVLLQAMESAIARKAFKKAVGFARRALVLDPINQAARQRMIELHVSHARKQMRSRRTDLAARELAEAAAWEHAPSFLLHINQGLVGHALGDAGADAQLRRGVELAGGGVKGWFRAALEHALMNGGEAGAKRVGDELRRAQEAAAPTREAILAVAAAVTASDPGDSRTVTALVSGLHGWLAGGGALTFTAREFHGVAEMFTRVGAFDLMGDYARAAAGRPGADEADAAVFRFYTLVAGCKGSWERLPRRGKDELFEMEQDAADRDDFHMANRITRFMEATGGGASPRRRRRPLDDDDDDLEAMLSFVMEHAMGSISPDVIVELLATRGVRRATAAITEILRKGTEGAIPEAFLRRVATILIEGTINEIHEQISK